jgi:lantibiotic modifying enzyme
MARMSQVVLIDRHESKLKEAMREGASARKEFFLEAADRIGATLCREAIWAGGRCNWLGWSMELVGHCYTACYRALPPSLYSGVAGVALFLARLCQFTHDSRQQRTLSGAVAQLLSSYPSLEAPPQLGYYSGLTGVGHTLTLIGELTGDSQLIERGIQVLEKTRDISLDATLIDVISGCAGTIPALIDAGQRYQKPGLLEIAKQQAEHLLRLRREDASGTSWAMPMGQQKNLLGFSHGTAGIAVALLEVHRLFPERPYLEAAQGALRYERSGYDQTMENWPDYRIDPYNPVSGVKFPVAWCNGATGIGCGRLRVAQLAPADPETLAEVNAALRTAIRSMTTPMIQAGTDLTFCHGMGGNADFLLQTAEQFDRADLRQIAENFGENAVGTFQRLGLPWPCGVPGAGETPALMLGTAGIGYFFLRLYDSQNVPSLLVLRPALGNITNSGERIRVLAPTSLEVPEANNA